MLCHFQCKRCRYRSHYAMSYLVGHAYTEMKVRCAHCGAVLGYSLKLKFWKPVIQGRITA